MTADQLRKEKVQIARYATRVFSELKRETEAAELQARVSNRSEELISALEYAMALLDDRELICPTDEIALTEYHLQRLAFQKETTQLLDDIYGTS